ncbi:cell division protein FtsB [Candidatus Methylospira mobilis]|uniref:Cell division protein FtsB n=1 Tax=Candidatus Methylospira mobilis TaxID=1808979 RepID=A0A5Q0BPN5_9GAMM|nr:cell division protein FtsB [Candidatus Methylospira mobilis]QFY44037.1 cell division protein FtsB [Candidatus Methylospira mobilis]WNV05041.1 cell division protein FtsB [Candidatus Methylospira mobilis]
MRKLLLFLIIVLILLQFRLWFGDSNLLELEELKQRADELTQRVHERKERNAALEAEIMDLKRGTDAIEERARFDLGMIREGEHFIQVLENPQQEPETAVPQNSAPEIKKAARPVAPKAKPRHTAQRAEAATPATTADHAASENYTISDE